MMDLQKLFKTQAQLDEHIYTKHPELRGQDNLDWKILALQVELGECANEWRGFKKWSKDQAPRTERKVICHSCKGLGEHHLQVFHGVDHVNDEVEVCLYCEGTGWQENRNPLLEEYVDCLHFILSIGLEMEMQFEEKLIWNFANTQDVINLFHEVIAQTADLFWDYKNKYETTMTYKAVLNHFIKLGEELGFTWDEIKAAYYAKNKINHARQASGRY